MTTEKNKKTIDTCDNMSNPIFTGDYIHDTTVSEHEKLSEASQAIFNEVIGKIEKKKGAK